MGGGGAQEVKGPRRWRGPGCGGAREVEGPGREGPGRWRGGGWRGGAQEVEGPGGWRGPGRWRGPGGGGAQEVEGCRVGQGIRRFCRSMEPMHDQQAVNEKGPGVTCLPTILVGPPQQLHPRFAQLGACLGVSDW